MIAAASGTSGDSGQQGNNTPSDGAIQGNVGSNVGVNEAGKASAATAGSGGTAGSVPGGTTTANSAFDYARILILNLLQMPDSGTPTMKNLGQVAKLVKAPATVTGIADANNDGKDDDSAIKSEMNGQRACLQFVGGAWKQAATC